MVGWIYRTEEVRWRVSLTRACPLGQPLLAAAVPLGSGQRGLKRGLKALAREGVRRVLLPPALLEEGGEALPERRGLAPVKPLALCRAKGAELALFLLADVPPRERRVLLRGEAVSPEARRLAEALCPQTGQLFLEFDRGTEELERFLRFRFGAAVRRWAQDLPPQAALELTPRPALDVPTLRLWGDPALSGLTLLPPSPLPADLPALPFLSLLWETGRLSLEEIRVGPGEWP